MKNILIAILIVVLARFVFGIVRMLARQGQAKGRPEVRRGTSEPVPPGGGRVIDVDYTEDPASTRKDR